MLIFLFIIMSSPSFISTTNSITFRIKFQAVHFFSSSLTSTTLLLFHSSYLLHTRTNINNSLLHLISVHLCIILILVLYFPLQYSSLNIFINDTAVVDYNISSSLPSYNLHRSSNRGSPECTTDFFYSSTVSVMILIFSKCG